MVPILYLLYRVVEIWAFIIPTIGGNGFTFLTLSKKIFLTYFYTDPWVGSLPLKDKFPKIFTITYDPNRGVGEVGR